MGIIILSRHFSIIACWFTILLIRSHIIPIFIFLTPSIPPQRCYPAQLSCSFSFSLKSSQFLVSTGFVSTMYMFSSSRHFLWFTLLYSLMKYHFHLLHTFFSLLFTCLSAFLVCLTCCIYFAALLQLLDNQYMFF